MYERDLLVRAEAFAREHTVTAEQWHLLKPAFEDLRDQLRLASLDVDSLLCVRVPLLVYAAIAGDDATAQPLAVALLLLHLGTELLDDVMDGDIRPVWQGYGPSQVSLAAAILYASLTPLALTTVDAPPEKIVGLQRTLTRGLLRVAAGQASDLALTGNHAVTSADVEDAIEGKSGDTVATYAELAAQLAGASAASGSEYATMGRCLGVAAQIRSECADLFATPVSRDLVSGARTLPLALHLERLAGQQREEFLALLDQARTEWSAQAIVREQLSVTGVVHTCAAFAEVQCQRARSAIVQAGAREPAAGALRSLIDSVSFFRDRTAPAAAAALGPAPPSQIAATLAI